MQAKVVAVRIVAASVFTWVACGAVLGCGSDNGNIGGAGTGTVGGVGGGAGFGGSAGFAGTGGSGGAGTGGVGNNGGVGGGDAGNAGMSGAGGVGGGDAGTGGVGNSGGVGGGDAGTGGGGAGSVSDYGAPGPFGDAKMISGVGPNAGYTIFRPDASLGRDGFKHPIAAWGNGISTTPNQYQALLTLIATHGIVVLACNDTMAERPCLSDGLDWLVAQNSAAGELQGKLDTSREATIGYSWGGGAAIDTANRPNVKATVSLHGMPPRGDTAFADMHSPLLLFTSTGDGFVTAEKYVTPNYQASTVQTFYATLDDATAGHLYVVDEGAISCVAVTLGTCKSAVQERAPTVAWLRLWLYGEEDARRFFYGDDCTLCRAPWTMPQRKHWL